MEVKVVETNEALEDAFYVRKKVFVEEQQVPEEEEIDDLEEEATHVILYDETLPAGAGRLRIVDGYGKMERICILPEYRGRGAGNIIMEKLEDVAKEKGASKFKLSAQTHAVSFYEKLGYKVISEEYLDAGIPHVTMVKDHL
ncbi:GNAT family N-acetyltransferase [Metabacillus arenae]|uniref:GNAT family N-acetyltransferase n=1 Tax=Metabacillus arenae TaxID=2771434 RepID=A0A926NIH2_9BACI|nr:GNAT family N-acetyltransferase [Metabacillus arenae]MBD1381956.1 GNAT family N-acetyltransferase [Metabacillus arenae]